MHDWTIILNSADDYFQCTKCTAHSMGTPVNPCYEIDPNDGWAIERNSHGRLLSPMINGLSCEEYQLYRLLHA